MRYLITCCVMSLLSAPAYADVTGRLHLGFQGGNYGGPDANVDGEDDPFEAQYFGLPGIEGSLYGEFANGWAWQVNGQLYLNAIKDRREIDAPGNRTRNDNHMSWGLAELHLIRQTSSIDWGMFAGLWKGELDDGEPDFSGNIDKAEKYYVGAEAILNRDNADYYLQLGFTDTIGSSFSNTPSEGTDFRQIRDGLFATVGGNFYLSDSLSLQGKFAVISGESSDSSNSIVPVDFTGTNVEFGLEYQPTDRPMTISGGLGYATGAFSGPNSENERVNSAYAFAGVTFWFGGSPSETRRRMLPVQSADFLISAESMAIGNLN